MQASLLSMLFSLLVSLVSCYSGKVEDKDAYVFNQFPAEKAIVAENYLKVDNIAVDGMLLYRDSFLLLRNAPGSVSSHFSLFNLKNKSLLASCLPAGRKEGSSLAFLSYGISNNLLWVDDIVKNAVIAGNMDSISSGKGVAFQEISMPLFYYSVQLMNGNKEAVGFGDYDAGYKLGIFDLSQGKVVKQLVPYSADSSHPVSRGEKTAYESFLFLKPFTNDKCVLACRYADRIEVVDLKNGQSKVVKGPENYAPRLTVISGSDGKELSTRNAETRYAFVKGKVTDKFIYLLYSGNNHESKYLNTGKYIYVYDWNGNPVQKISCNDYIVDFAVASDDKVLYTYNPKTKFVQISTL